MSAEVMVRAALVEALRADTALMQGLNGLFDGRPARATEPYGVVADCLASDWGAKDIEGRELTIAIQLFDVRETVARLAPLLARVEAVMRTAQAEGWRIVSARLVRSRLSRTDGRDGWQALMDFRLRVVPV